MRCQVSRPRFFSSERQSVARFLSLSLSRSLSPFFYSSDRFLFPTSKKRTVPSWRMRRRQRRLPRAPRARRRPGRRSWFFECLFSDRWSRAATSCFFSSLCSLPHAFSFFSVSLREPREKLRARVSWKKEEEEVEVDAFSLRLSLFLSLAFARAKNEKNLVLLTLSRSQFLLHSPVFLFVLFAMRVGVTVSRASATASASTRPLSQRLAQASLQQQLLLRRPTATPLSSSAVVVASSSARRRRRSSTNLLVVRASASFDSLSNSLSKAWDSIRIDGKLTAENIKGPMREIRRALLEADVSFRSFSPYFLFLDSVGLSSAVKLRLFYSLRS